MQTNMKIKRKDKDQTPKDKTPKTKDQKLSQTKQFTLDSKPSLLAKTSFKQDKLCYLLCNAPFSMTLQDGLLLLVVFLS